MGAESGTTGKLVHLQAHTQKKSGREVDGCWFSRVVEIEIGNLVEVELISRSLQNTPCPKHPCLSSERLLSAGESACLKRAPMCVLLRRYRHI